MPRQMNPNTVVDFFPMLEPLSSSDAIIVDFDDVVVFVDDLFVKDGFIRWSFRSLLMLLKGVYVWCVCVRLLALSPPGGLEECSSSSRETTLF